jgi:hypothetical protein
MNNTKITNLPEVTTPMMDSVTVMVADDTASKVSLENIKSAITAGNVTIGNDLTVGGVITGDGTGITNLVLNDYTLGGETMIAGSLEITSGLTVTGDVMITGDTQSVYNWTSPNDTTWSIVECQGHNTVSITGDTGIGQIWFPFSGVPMSNDTENMNNNHLRGGVITYYAHCNGNNNNTLQTGTVHFVRDDNAATEENRARTNGISDIYFGEGGSNLGIKVYANDVSEYDIIVQWTAKLFYAEEFFC